MCLQNLFVYLHPFFPPSILPPNPPTPSPLFLFLLLLWWIHTVPVSDSKGKYTPYWSTSLTSHPHHPLSAPLLLSWGPSSLPHPHLSQPACLLCSSSPLLTLLLSLRPRPVSFSIPVFLYSYLSICLPVSLSPNLSLALSLSCTHTLAHTPLHLPRLLTCHDNPLKNNVCVGSDDAYCLTSE